MVFTSIPQNYRNNVDWILGAYTDAGVTFPNGFQKDAIQNAVGARPTKNWKNWRCDISLIENDRGRYVVVEDSGTVGLTGNNTPAEQINELMAEGKVLPPEERLSRFTSMFNSGGNTTGGGLFGAGKSVYSVASKTYTYYYDSLREDGMYVSNVNKGGQVNSIAYEGSEAKKYIKENTGLDEKKTVGTRIIIEKPKDELVESITSGELVPLIQESWWLIIERLPAGSAITVNNVPITVPDDIKKTRRAYELQKPESYSQGYKVKHFGLYVFEDGGNIWSGLSYYRKGMKIGEIDIKDIPKDVEGKFWGYVEVDELWEDELSDIEDKVHFGVSKGKKHTNTYQNLKNYCNNKFHENMVKWGFIKDNKTEDKKLKDELQSIAEELQDLFDNLEFENLGTGPQKPDFDVRWQDIRYPVAETEKVTSGDEIAFSVRIKNSYTTDKKFDYKILVVDPENRSVLHQIDAGEITVKANTVHRMDKIHTVTKKNSKQYAENRIVLSVKVIGSGKEKTKVLPYFFDIDKPDTSRETVGLTLHECLFPVQVSRRVNFGEAVRKVCWKIENKRNHTLNYRLNVSIHKANASDKTCPKIVDVLSLTGIIPPFEDQITHYLDEIVFDKDTYEPYLSEGTLELRARLIANEDDPIYEKGDKITSYHFKIFLNMDEKNGKRESFRIELSKSKNNFERSWRTPGNDRKITINIEHPAYNSVADYPDFRHDYLREQMLKQYVLLYLDEGKYDIFGDGFIGLEPQEAADKVLQKVESVYYESLK